MKILMTESQIEQALAQMAAKIAADVPAGADLAVVGIRRRGETLARRLVPLLRNIGAAPRHEGALDITLYRDDLTTIGPKAVTRGTEIDFDVTNTWMILVDDVLYTGRSVRAALDAIVDLGRPRAIKLAALVDRGWRELPIHADYAGLTLETTSTQIVKVKLREIDGANEVELVEQAHA